MIAEVRFRERELVTQAWREWRLCSAYLGQSPDAQPVRSPRWFRLVELGFDLGEGPSLMWTCRALEDDNRRALKQLGVEAPCRVTYPLPSPPRRRRPNPPPAETHDGLAARLLERLGLRPSDCGTAPTQRSTPTGA